MNRFVIRELAMQNISLTQQLAAADGAVQELTRLAEESTAQAKRVTAELEELKTEMGNRESQRETEVCALVAERDEVMKSSSSSRNPWNPCRRRHA